MKKVIVALVLIIALTIAVIFVSQKNLSEKEVLKGYDFPKNISAALMPAKKYFVPVAAFDNLEREIDLSALNKYEFVAYTGTSISIYPVIKVTYIQKENIYEELRAGKVALLPPEDVTPDMLTLKVNGTMFWSEQNQLRQYPFYDIYYEKPGSLADNYSKKNVQTIFSSGEIITARAVDRLSLNKNNNYTYLFSFFRSDIEDANVALTMLENSMLGDPEPCTGCTRFVSDERVIPGLAEVGFDIVSTAGNHAGDGGQKSISRTIELLEANNLKYTGTGNTNETLLKPALTKLGSKTVGFLAADDIAYFYWDKDGSASTYGTNYFSQSVGKLDTARIERIKEVKAENNIDILIVYMSWGVEYTNKQNSYQQSMAHLFIDNGVDIVIASHPHWVQGMEFYKGKPIFYSLGNFIFDQTHTLETRQGAALNLYFYKEELKSIEIMPLQSCGYHQTANDKTNDFLQGKIDTDVVYNYNENEACVYWMPRKLKADHPSYQQILQRIFAHSVFPY